MNRPNPLFRNLNSKIASLPMIFIVLVRIYWRHVLDGGFVLHQHQNTADFYASGIL